MSQIQNREKNIISTCPICLTTNTIINMGMRKETDITTYKVYCPRCERMENIHRATHYIPIKKGCESQIWRTFSDMSHSISKCTKDCCICDYLNKPSNKALQAKLEAQIQKMKSYHSTSRENLSLVADWPPNHSRDFLKSQSPDVESEGVSDNYDDSDHWYYRRKVHSKIDKDDQVYPSERSYAYTAKVEDVKKEPTQLAPVDQSLPPEEQTIQLDLSQTGPNSQKSEPVADDPEKQIPLWLKSKDDARLHIRSESNIAVSDQIEEGFERAKAVRSVFEKSWAVGDPANLLYNRFVNWAKKKLKGALMPGNAKNMMDSYQWAETYITLARNNDTAKTNELLKELKEEKNTITK